MFNNSEPLTLSNFQNPRSTIVGVFLLSFRDICGYSSCLLITEPAQLVRTVRGEFYVLAKNVKRPRTPPLTPNQGPPSNLRSPGTKCAPTLRLDQILTREEHGVCRWRRRGGGLYGVWCMHRRWEILVISEGPDMNLDKNRVLLWPYLPNRRGG